MKRQDRGEEDILPQEIEENEFLSFEDEPQEEAGVEEQLKVLHQKLDQLIEENDSKDRKITELQRERERSSEDLITLESLQAQIQEERQARIRSEFALKNGVAGDLLEFLTGENEEELQSQWKNLKTIIEKKAKEYLKENRQKLSTLPQGSQGSTGKEDLVKQIFASQK